MAAPPSLHHSNSVVHVRLAPSPAPDQGHEYTTFLHQRVEKTGASLNRSWSKFTRQGRQKIGIRESLKNIVLFSWGNIFLVFLPVGWVAHFLKSSGHSNHLANNVFTFCFLGIMPLQKLFEYGGDQMACYLGKDLGDLLIITLNNIVEATLAIVLLVTGELRLLQSTVIGVVLLHLLLVPGVSFLVGGARLAHQELHPHFSQLNQTLLCIGVLTFAVPAIVFAALDRPVIAAISIPVTPVVSDSTRSTFLTMSRVLAIVLLVVYVCSRIFLHNPPRDCIDDDDEEQAKEARRARRAKRDEEPEVNQYVCIAMLVICIALLAATVEWLAEDVDSLKSSAIEMEWFGLILLPLLSFAADGVSTVRNFIHAVVRHFFKGPEPPSPMAKARAIDLSIQFMLFWAPFFIILSWGMGTPFSLLFDFFEVSVLVCACFIVNYVTADSKTNWAEGLAMVAFYVIIAVCAWHYPGQQSIEIMLVADKSVEEELLRIAAAANGTTT
ncbi:hypothetical protein AX14_011601 [Amanita brunnescens Koide BX004]|nr:hypothetical protein AX14_011601 [Amanita brunnescens Koide BX004]